MWVHVVSSDLVGDYLAETATSRKILIVNDLISIGKCGFVGRAGEFFVFYFS